MRKDQMHQILRIMVGNQIAMMRMLRPLASPVHDREFEIRVLDIKDWWRREFNEEVGFSAALGDEPIAGTEVV